MKNKLLQSRGITLIALVITIIVLLILAGIAIASLTGDNGLLARTVSAKENTVVAQEKEQLQIEAFGSCNTLGKLEIENLKTNITSHLNATHDNSTTFPLVVTYTETGNSYQIDENGTIGDIQITDRTGISVGDFIDYEPDVPSTTVYPHATLDTYSGSTSNTADIIQNSLNWRVLRIYRDGSMDLIGNATSQYIYFQGILGYKNGVYLMDAICKTLYSRNSEGIEARNIDIEDLEYWLSSSTQGVTARNNYTSSYGIKYGDEKKYSNIRYKVQTNESDPGTLTDNKSYELIDELSVKQTYYKINVNQSNYSLAARVIGNTTWVASRYADCNGESRADLGLRMIDGGGRMSGYYMTNTSGGSYGTGAHLHPVVHLKSKVQITPSSKPTYSNTPHHITSY